MALNVYDTGNTADNFSRKDLLSWVNSKLDGAYAAIEDMCTGAAYCQFLDILYPGVVNLKRVIFTTQLEHEYIRNFKIVQNAFTDLGINKDIPVERLVKGRFQDNYEFLSWFKKFFEANDDNRPYNASEARFGNPLRSEYSRQSTAEEHRTDESNTRPVHTPEVRSSRQPKRHLEVNKRSRIVPHFESDANTETMDAETDSLPTSANMVNVHLKAGQRIVATTPESSGGEGVQSGSGIKPPSASILRRIPDASKPKKDRPKVKGGRVSRDTGRIKRRTEMEELVLIGLKIEELYLSVEAVENERDFYYRKLVNVENWCSNQKNRKLVESLHNVLYSEDDDGILTLGEGEELRDDVSAVDGQ